MLRKRIVALLAAGAMLTGTLAGCGNSDSGSKAASTSGSSTKTEAQSASSESRAVPHPQHPAHRAVRLKEEMI